MCSVENGDGTVEHDDELTGPTVAGVPSPHMRVYALHTDASWMVAVTVRGATPKRGEITKEPSAGFGEIVTVFECKEPLGPMQLSVYEVRLPDMVPAVEPTAFGATGIETGRAPPIV